MQHTLYINYRTIHYQTSAANVSMISNFPWEEWVNAILQWLMIPGHIPDGHFSNGHFPDGHFPDLTHP